MTQCPRCGKDNPAEIHTCTPLALRLADALLEPVVLDKHAMQAAAELRRLHAQRDELLEALKQARGEVQYMASGMTHSAWRTKQAQDAMANIDAAIAKVEAGK